MVSVLQESAPSYTMVKKWARLFQQGRESCEDDLRPGRPVTIAEELQISKERVGEIIHEYMNMRKISARWVTKMLTSFDKQRRLQTSKDFLELVGDNIDEICDRIVTVDETWVRQYDPESKQESMQWTKKGERPPKKFKAREQSYRSDVSYRAECCFTRQCICPHGAGFEAGPEGHGLRKLTTHLQPRSSSQRLFPFPI
ncbi:Histone-lysine N-methyltransferase SETMAR [Eumeta japonica]|uniref:Histone-lysine N-methyltransferase SETMAR n=1 Tax=Eumeta variegata TaxID=151549 RepID=A0A4C1VPJ6_EUMVA|nr:Histone-lysine N-methyltransferase SETMAR [Eumeta japonica]